MVASDVDVFVIIHSKDSSLELDAFSLLAVGVVDGVVVVATCRKVALSVAIVGELPIDVGSTAVSGASPKVEGMPTVGESYKLVSWL